MNGDGDERQTKSQVRIAEIDETTGSRVNRDQNGKEIQSGVDAFASFPLRVEGKGKEVTCREY